LNLLRTYAFICTTFIILNKQTLDQIKGNTVHLLSKPYFLASYTFLVKHHQNSKAKLLHHRYLEQNRSEVKLSHAKHVEQIYSKRLQLKVDSQNTVSGYQHVHPEYPSKKKNSHILCRSRSSRYQPNWRMEMGRKDNFDQRFNFNGASIYMAGIVLVTIRRPAFAYQDRIEYAWIASSHEDTVYK
jgi:hypothetical protein